MWKKIILTGCMLQACCCDWAAAEEAGGESPKAEQDKLKAGIDFDALQQIPNDAIVKDMVRQLGYKDEDAWEARLWKDSDDEPSLGIGDDTNMKDMVRKLGYKDEEVWAVKLWKDADEEPSLHIKVQNNNIWFIYRKTHNFSVEGGLYTCTQDGKDDVNVRFTPKNRKMIAAVYLLNMNLKIDRESLNQLKAFGNNPIINYIFDDRKLHSREFITSTQLPNLQLDIDERKFTSHKNPLLDELVQISISPRIVGAKMARFNITQRGRLLHLTLQK